MERFGPYDLIEVVGRGGMGEVHRARHREQRRDVAVKVLAAGGAADREFTERFRRESYLAASLNDPHVIPIHSYGEIDGRLYLEMRLVEGVDLGRMLRDRGGLPTDRALALLDQAASALDAAHARRLVHRDVKPSNLLVTPDDFVYLVDFGIAQAVGTGAAGTALTATGAAIGTFAYMAPERFEPRPSGPPVDVYALTCVLFETLTGRAPFTAESLPALMHAHFAAPPPLVSQFRTDLPHALDDVIAAGMAKNPADRPPSATALIEAARAASTDGSSVRRRAARAETWVGPDPRRGPVPRQPPPPPPQPRPTSREDPRPPARAGGAGWIVAAGVLVAASILVAAVVIAGASSGSAGADQSGGAGAAAPTTADVPGASTTTRPSGDLGLGQPMASPACSGTLVVVVKSAVDPSRYVADVSGALAQFPGANYTLTGTSCSSFAPRDGAGNAIYAVYLGPFATVSQACSAQATAGGDSYLRRLDDVTPPGTTIDCG
ncbi:serine/threonine-protein kinase [Actinomycetospora sp. OC33-EN06]|uniref:non-specific serine/threonine protein kinase n=1 Tax=Actinomycetospora aeridis TaxID=3129231 RepID=A0ABU8NCD1_9PSEU